MDNKKMLLCISLAVITTIFSTSLNSWAQSRNSYQGQQGSQQAPQQSKQEEQEQQLQRQIILQGNSQRQQVLDQFMLERQQLITKRVADQIVMSPTQAYELTRTAVTANPGISDAITAASIKAVPEKAAAITQAAVETCIPGQAQVVVVYSAILAGAEPATVAEAARRGGATSVQIKAGETRALQQLQLQQKKDTDSTATKTKSGPTAGMYNASDPSQPPPVPKPIPK